MNFTRTANNKARVCFVSLNSSHLLFHESNGSFMGGAELQQHLIGSELSRRGRGVTFITRKPEAAEPCRCKDIDVITTFRQSDGWPVLRFFYPRTYTILKALYSVDTDVYYVRGSSFILALVVLVAKWHKRAVVFCGAYDLDFEPKKIQLPSPRDKWMYLWGLKQVDVVIAQNETQQRLAQDNLGITAEKIHNCYPAVSGHFSLNPEALWVGNFRDTKNPEAYLALAKNIPEFRFNMIGGKPGQRDFQEIVGAAKKIANLNYLGFQPLEETDKYFEKVKLFVNTSEYEGFPNTFLQAWSRGVPVISFVDPDGLITKNDLGIVVKNLNEMTDCARAILNNELVFSNENIRRYFLENHLVEKIVDKYEVIFEKISQSKC
jgi:glycosyltransferase involved in cell wall biosynthesis